MKVPLPNLDDRRWVDLIDEGRALIPVYASDWTDHNIHDPGITLLELFAWIVEMDIYQLNRISDKHKRKFLELISVTVSPPQPARTVLSFTLKDGSASRRLTVNTEFACQDPFGDETRFRLLEPLVVADNELVEIQVKDVKGFHDLTRKRGRGESLAIFGETPQCGVEFYLGFSKPFRLLRPVSVFFTFECGSDQDQKSRLIAQQQEGSEPCPHESDCTDQEPRARVHKACDCETKIPPLNRVRLVWEIFAKTGGKPRWLELDPKLRLVEDDTRSLTLNGRITFRAPARMVPLELGQSPAARYYLRCRFEAGSLDAPPVARTINLNSTLAEQSVPVIESWIVEPEVNAQGTEPKPGDIVGVVFTLNARGHVTSLRFLGARDGIVGFRVLQYIPATQWMQGRLTLEAVRLGQGNAKPHQVLELPLTSAQQSSFKLYSEENELWRTWTRVDDFVESNRQDAHFVLDHENGAVVFGDGEHGRVPPTSSNIFATYSATRAEEGNAGARTIFTLPDSPINRVVLTKFDATKESLEKITNPLAATGGEPLENLDHATGRAIDLMTSTWRAVTLADYEELARKTPGARVARARAKANLYASFPCLKASGIVTIIVLPDMPGPRPMPSRGLLSDISAYLRSRRIIGTRVEVIAPRYLEVAVRVRVKALTGASKTTVKQSVEASLNQFFSPLKGGSYGTGWPFGRDVFRSEVLQVIDEVAGVDHVLQLELIAERCEPVCGNVCLSPTSLVAAGNHDIQVV